jgi:hypothetical protein
MASAVYQEDSQIDSAKMASDPAGKLFWRHPRRRLEAETIRDAILSVSGALDTTMYGAGSLDDQMRRRGIYFTVKRSKLVPMMVIFDAPDALSGIAARASTTIAPQALLLMNNTLVRDAARRFGQRIDAGDVAGGSILGSFAAGGGGNLASLVERGYRTALARPASTDELADGVEFLTGQIEAYQSDGRSNARELALTDFCQVLIGLNEFVYVE